MVLESENRGESGECVCVCVRAWYVCVGPRLGAALDRPLATFICRGANTMECWSVRQEAGKMFLI
jgi:hypothetical protein